MVSFITLPTLRFPKQNRLTLEGLEAIGKARQRRKAQERRNRMMDAKEKREDEEFKMRKRREDLEFKLAQRRAGPLMMQPSFGGLSSAGVRRLEPAGPRAHSPSLESPHVEHQMMDSAMPHRVPMRYEDFSNAK